jgi:hypothetical protein
MSELGEIRDTVGKINTTVAIIEERQSSGLKRLGERLDETQDTLSTIVTDLKETNGKAAYCYPRVRTIIKAGAFVTATLFLVACERILSLVGWRK